MAKILVVDDEADTRGAFGVALERAGHAVTKVADGAQAARLHHDDAFDLIISDLAMPGLDGIELTRTVRGDLRADIPILLVTASASPQDLAEAHRAGITAHLAKPVKLAELRDRVEALLAAARPLPTTRGRAACG